MFDTRSDFFSDYYTDEPIIVTNESKAEEPERHDQTDSREQPEDTSAPSSSLTSTKIPELQAQSKFPDINQLTAVLVNSLKPKLSNLLASHDFNTSILNELKELPSRITALSGDIKELQQHVKSLLKIPDKVHDVPMKLDTLTSNISSIASQIAELKTHQWKPSADVTDTLNRFADTLQNASSRAGTISVPSADKVGTSPAKGEKNTNQPTISQLFQRKMSKDAEQTNLKQPTYKSPFSPSPSSSPPQT
ncbi:hypothetical protein Tco_1208256 [Tanacetum coccineum]